jgi:hypothetical protein
MTMMTEVDLYNEIYSKENPVDVFNDINSPYYDYYCKLLETNTYYDNIFKVDSNKLSNWSMSIDQQIGNLMIVYYASYFELFAQDGLISTFYRYFPKYCECVLLDEAGCLFKDLNGDTFLHYASYSFDTRDAASELYRLVHSDNNKVLHPMYMKNLHNVTPNDILLLE